MKKFWIFAVIGCILAVVGIVLYEKAMKDIDNMNVNLHIV